MPGIFASSVIMIRPAAFEHNVQTADSNSFQKFVTEFEPEEINANAQLEFDLTVQNLRNEGVIVKVFEDTPTPIKPDAVFSNNWMSTHQDGKIILYPMMAENRRLERNPNILENLKSEYLISEIIDLTTFEKENQFLEGTGSLVFDHANRIVYASLSVRTSAEILKNLCTILNYKAIIFKSYDKKGLSIYHTNVVMWLGDDFAFVCEDVIQEGKEELVESLEKSGKQVIPIHYRQLTKFAGNMLMLNSLDGKSILAASETAWNSLNKVQIAFLTSIIQPVISNISTIEKYGGGSMRCILTENFLTKIS